MAGSTGTYELRLFDRNEGNKCIDVVRNGIELGVNSIDFANHKHNATFGSSDSTVYQLDIF
jgi:hypothetical protein